MIRAANPPIPPLEALAGMENHALHGYGLYYASPAKLWVNVYASSTADWAAEGVKLAMDTSFPEGDAAKLTLTMTAPKTHEVKRFMSGKSG